MPLYDTCAIRAAAWPSICEQMIAVGWQFRNRLAPASGSPDTDAAFWSTTGAPDIRSDVIYLRRPFEG